MHTICDTIYQSSRFDFLLYDLLLQSSRYKVVENGNPPNDLNDLGTPVNSISSTQILIAEAEKVALNIWLPKVACIMKYLLSRPKFLSVSIYDKQFWLWRTQLTLNTAKSAPSTVNILTSPPPPPVLSHLNYCPLVWHFCRPGDLTEMVKVKRFVFNDFHASYSDLRSRAGRPLLYIERLKAIVTEVSRMDSNVSPEHNRSILVKLSTSYNVRNNKRLNPLNYGTC